MTKGDVVLNPGGKDVYQLRVRFRKFDIPGMKVLEICVSNVVIVRLQKVSSKLHASIQRLPHSS